MASCCWLQCTIMVDKGRRVDERHRWQRYFVDILRMDQCLHFTNMFDFLISLVPIVSHTVVVSRKLMHPFPQPAILPPTITRMANSMLHAKLYFRPCFFSFISRNFRLIPNSCLGLSAYACSVSFP